MVRTPSPEQTVADLDLSNLPVGEILRPLDPIKDVERSLSETWETPLSPWGGFKVPSALSVELDDGRKVLAFGESDKTKGLDRAILARSEHMRDCHIAAVVRFVDSESSPNEDRADLKHALAGPVFRVQTSRWYYQFAIEGRERAVLIRRKDDEWAVLVGMDVQTPDGYVTLEVETRGDGIFCRIAELDVDFHYTDTTFKAGKAGFRSVGRSLLSSLHISQTQSQMSADQKRSTSLYTGDIPRAPVLVKTIDLVEMGGAPKFADFYEPDRYDILVQTDTELRAETSDGQRLWEIPLVIRRPVFSRDHVESGGRLLYGFTGKRHERHEPDIAGRLQEYTIDDEMVIISCKTGEIVSRQPLPDAVESQRYFDFAPTTGSFNTNEAKDIVLREWVDNLGGGGSRLWALDGELNLLWEQEQKGAHYGHHWALTMFDVDGDGWDDLLAGGVLYDRHGNVRWTHDRHEEVSAIYGASHYDAVALGDLADDSEINPTCFLLAGSAGVYVVDGLTGETNAVHRVGHAQGRQIAAVRTDLNGDQVIVATRWGNMGIITLFSGRGDRLWTMQPDSIGQGAVPVTWGDWPTQLIWTNTSKTVQAFYDGHGQLLRRLPELSELWGDEMRLGCGVIRMGSADTDYTSIARNGKLYVFGPEE